MACRKRGRPSSWIRREKRRSIYARDSYTCVLCNFYCDASNINEVNRVLTIDHVRARNNGGHNHHTNLVTACRRCNSSRQDKPIKKWCDEKCLDYQSVRRRIRNAVRRKLP